MSKVDDRRLMSHLEVKDHEQLQDDLARFMDGEGMVSVPRFQLPHGGQQIDVLVMAPYKYARPDIRAYEVKVSRSDYLADTRVAKWTGYLKYANRVFFAAPAGLLKQDDIPLEAGLIVRGDKGWQVVKAARYQLEPKGWTDADWMALLSRNHEFKSTTRRIRDRISLEDNVELAGRAHALGYEIRSRLQRETPREESAGHRVWAALVELDPKATSEYDAIRILRAAFAMRKHIGALTEISEFLSAVAYGGEDGDKRLREMREAIAEAVS